MTKKKSSNTLYVLILIGVLLLITFTILSSVLSVGERLRTIHPYVEYSFYGVSILLFYFLILRPIFIITFSPSFSIETTLDGKSKKNFSLYKKIAKRLIELENLSLEEKSKLESSLSDFDSLKENLYHTFNHHIKKTLNKVIRNNAKTVLISTAISQNSKLDSITVIAVNLKMIKEMVVICGFRPSLKNLSKLSINVFLTAMIAEGLENLNLSDVLPTSTMNIIGEIPFLKPILSSVISGIGNALLTLRIGYVTRKYLFSDAKEMTKDEIRRGALIEAAKNLPLVIGDALAFFPSKVVSLFKKSFDENKNEPDYDGDVDKTKTSKNTKTEKSYE